MKIYTKQGDDGTTRLFGGLQVPKHHLRVETYGTVDELNACMGVAVALPAGAPDDAFQAILSGLQHTLFVLGSDLATPAQTQHENKIRRIGAADITKLEQHIDLLDGRLAPLATFILPGGSPLAAQLHVARAVCRRAERLASLLVQQRQASGETLIFLNRLSDLLFVMARYANHLAGLPDVPWKK